MAPRHPTLLLLLLALALLAAPRLRAQPLVWPGEKMATVEGRNLRAFVPWDHRERLLPLVQEADALYGRMILESGYRPSRRLKVLFGDFRDAHNGYSMVVPLRLVQTELAPATGPSTIFSGADHVRRTLVHEFAHHLANDRNFGFRRFMERLVGRVAPFDPLSVATWYLSTPPHQTMPRFWQEGLGIWAETEYAPPGSAWGGRGRDPLVHMVWRLATRAGQVPAAADWRLTHHRWPYGNTAYLYGAAYLRHLAGRVGRKGIWQLVDHQARHWPYRFDRGPVPALGATHGELLAEARAALLKEQGEALKVLGTKPFTVSKRLTPKGSLVGAPAWTEKGGLVFAMRPSNGRPRVYFWSRDGSLFESKSPAYALGGIRRHPFGCRVRHEFNWREISQIHIRRESDPFPHMIQGQGERLIQPDLWIRERSDRAMNTRRWEAMILDGDVRLVAIRFAGGGRQELVRYVLPASFPFGELESVVSKGAETKPPTPVIPTRGRPWTPTFRPGLKGSLCWVETDRAGSRLVLSATGDGKDRKILFRCRGRILHPAWSADGEELYFCADHTGVANAWCWRDGKVEPVTHSAGGVLACVPSPDGKRLALVEHDHHGPYIAIIPNDRSKRPGSLPVLELAWPAAGGKTRPSATKPTRPAPKATPPHEYEVAPYGGLAETRLRFVTPTTTAVPEGGVGLFAMAADPLLRNVIGVGAGFGPVEGEPVGFLGYNCLAWPVEVGVSLRRAERTWARRIVDTGGREYDYTELVDTAEVRLGRSLDRLEDDFMVYMAAGVSGLRRDRDPAKAWRGRTLVNTPPLDGEERYVQFILTNRRYAFYPTSHSPEEGHYFHFEYRHSGLGGDLKRDLGLAEMGITMTMGEPEWGVQMVVRGHVGWSKGDEILQGAFTIGGSFARDLPRGWLRKTEATGPFLLGGSAAWRMPLWRPFTGISTTPLAVRQLFGELYLDTAKVSTNRPDGDGHWYTSAGFELKMGLEWDGMLLQPGFGVAVHLDGDKDVLGYLVVGVPF